MRRAAIVGTILWLVALFDVAIAQTYFCDRPTKPYIPSFSTDRFEMENARDEVERYTRRMREYIDCLKNESDDAVEEHRRVINEWNDAVSNFNNR
jgi:hypothetical protein